MSRLSGPTLRRAWRFYEHRLFSAWYNVFVTPCLIARWWCIVSRRGIACGLGAVGGFQTEEELRALIPRLEKVCGHTVAKVEPQYRQETGEFRGFAYIEWSGVSRGDPWKEEASADPAAGRVVRGLDAGVARVLQTFNATKWHGHMIRIERAREDYESRLQREQQQAGALFITTDESSHPEEKADISSSAQEQAPSRWRLRRPDAVFRRRQGHRVTIDVPAVPQVITIAAEDAEVRRLQRRQRNQTEHRHRRRGLYLCFDETGSGAQRTEEESDSGLLRNGNDQDALIADPNLAIALGSLDQTDSGDGESTGSEEDEDEDEEGGGLQQARKQNGIFESSAPCDRASDFSEQQEAVAEDDDDEEGAEETPESEPEEEEEEEGAAEEEEEEAEAGEETEEEEGEEEEDESHDDPPESPSMEKRGGNPSIANDGDESDAEASTGEEPLAINQDEEEEAMVSLRATLRAESAHSLGVLANLLGDESLRPSANTASVEPEDIHHVPLSRAEEAQRAALRRAESLPAEQVGSLRGSASVLARIASHASATASAAAARHAATAATAAAAAVPGLMRYDPRRPVVLPPPASGTAPSNSGDSGAQRDDGAGDRHAWSRRSDRAVEVRQSWRGLFGMQPDQQPGPPPADAPLDRKGVHNRREAQQAAAAIEQAATFRMLGGDQQEGASAPRGAPPNPFLGEATSRESTVAAHGDAGGPVGERPAKRFRAEEPVETRERVVPISVRDLSAQFVRKDSGRSWQATKQRLAKDFRRKAQAAGRAKRGERIAGNKDVAGASYVFGARKKR